MKIAVLYSANLPNTYANSINTLKHADAFSQLGHEVTVCYLSTGNKDIDIHEFYDISKRVSFHAVKRKFNIPLLLEEVWKKIQVKISSFLRIPKNSKQEQRLAQYVIHNDFDFVYARNYMASCTIIKAEIPVVVETHSASIDNPSLKALLSLNKCNNFKIATISEILKKNFVQKGGMRENKVVVQEDAVDISKYDAVTENKLELREVLNLPVNKKIVTYSGSLRKGKGIDSLLLVVESLKESEDILFLVVGGSESEKQTYQKKSEKLGLANIVFVGFTTQKKIPLYLKASDILIMLYSNTEKNRVMDINTTSPIKLFEYMASKVPIVASDIPTIAKIISKNEHAMMQKPDDIIQIKENILLLLNDKNLQEKIAGNAFELVQKYTYRKRCETLINSWKK